MIKLITACCITLSLYGTAYNALAANFGTEAAITNMYHEAAQALLNETRIISAVRKNGDKIQTNKIFIILNNINLRIAKVLNMLKSTNYNIQDVEKTTEEIRQLSEFAAALVKISLYEKPTLRNILQKTLEIDIQDIERDNKTNVAVVQKVTSLLQALFQSVIKSIETPSQQSSEQQELGIREIFNNVITGTNVNIQNEPRQLLQSIFKQIIQNEE